MGLTCPPTRAPTDPRSTNITQHMRKHGAPARTLHQNHIQNAPRDCTCSNQNLFGMALAMGPQTALEFWSRVLWKWKGPQTAPDLWNLLPCIAFWKGHEWFCKGPTNGPTCLQRGCGRDLGHILGKGTQRPPNLYSILQKRTQIVPRVCNSFFRIQVRS